MADFEPILKHTFKWEGGYQNYANDTANYNSLGQLVGTNRGISAKAWESYFKKPPRIEDIKAITPELAKKIYKKNYWEPIKGDLIKNQDVAALMFQAFIGSGYVGLKHIKEAINDTAGKQLVPINNAAITRKEAEIINKLPQKNFFNTLKEKRRAFFYYLEKSNPDKYSKFIKGWINRLNSFTFSEKKNIKYIIPAIVLLILLSSWQKK